MGTPAAVWETLYWVSYCHIVIASRWLKASAVQISFLKVRTTELPALEMELQAQCLGESD